MRIRKVGEVVAIRKLQSKNDSFTVRIGKPIRIPESGKSSAYYECPIDLRGRAGREAFWSIAGEDSMQALILGLQFLGTILRHKQKELSLTWFGDRELGFPKT